jgi:hypothetical protein
MKKSFSVQYENLFLASDRNSNESKYYTDGGLDYFYKYSFVIIT